MHYKNGVLGLVSYQLPVKELVSEKLNYFSDGISRLSSDLIVGISGYNNRLLSCSNAITQAISAAESRLHFPSGSQIVYYNNMGILKLLMLLNGRQELEDFYHEILDPIFKFDKENKAQIFESMCTFIECGRDYKKRRPVFSFIATPCVTALQKRKN